MSARRAGDRSGSRRGVGLPELLVSLAIVAALLTATAAAVDACFDAYAANQAEADRVQRTRVAMHRVVTLLRAAREHVPASGAARAEFSAGRVATDSGVSLFTPEGVDLTYAFDAPSGELRQTGPAGTFVLLRNVRRFDVTFEPMRSARAVRTGGSFDLLRRATITLTVSPDTTLPAERAGDAITMTASVVPRANVW